MDKNAVKLGVEYILWGLIGPDWKLDANYEGTPDRVARFYEEMFARNGHELTTFPDAYDQMIVLAHHLDWTLCPHHLLPVKLDISLAYIPAGRVLGLSKLARLIRHCLRLPILQETLTDRIADELGVYIGEDLLGSAVLIYGEHACMQLRGVKSSGYTVTSNVRGVFREKPEVKEEFLALVRR